jgi:pSer/pThr/pTyr-binding forkhead associated (FHA) protein
MICNQCGHTNPPSSRYCSSCGSSLDAAAPRTDETTTMLPVATGAAEAGEIEVDVAAGDVPHGSGMLMVKRGPNAGSRYVLEGKRISAGRSPDADIFLDDITVSRHHAEFVPLGDVYEVRDTGSLNGTYLNRERIESATMANGDEIQIGKFRLVFLVGDAG